MGGSERSVIRGLVVDANAFGHGHFDARVLRQWAAALARVDVEVWLPEPVAWELAEHAQRAYDEISAQVHEQLSPLRKAEVDIDEFPERDVAGEVLERLEDLDNVVIVPLSGGEAVEAIRDQVLVRPPGRRVAVRTGKGGEPVDQVKTGASDSAWIRAVHAHAGGDSDSYWVLSADSDVAETYRANGWEKPKIFPTFRDVVRESPELGPGTTTLRAAIFEFLNREFVIPVSVDPHDARTMYEDLPSSIGHDVRMSAALRRRLDDRGVVTRQYEIQTSIVRIDAVVGLRDLEAELDYRVAFAEVAFEGELEIVVWEWDDVDHRLVSESGYLWNARLSAPLTFEWEPPEDPRAPDDVGEVTVVGVANDSGDVAATVNESRYDDADDALADLVDEVAVVTDGLFDLHPLRDGDEVTVDAPGATIEVRSEPNYPDGETGEWVVTASDGTEEVEVVAEFDADAWVGGSEGMWMEPPVYLRVRGGNLAVRSAAGRLSNFYLQDLTTTE